MLTHDIMQAGAATTSAMSLLPLVAHWLELGESPSGIERAVGMLPSERAPTARYPIAQAFALWEHVARRLEDPTLPVQLANRAGLESAHLLGFVSETAPTLGAALHAVIEHGALHTNSGRWRVDTHSEPRRVTLRWSRPGRLTLGHRLSNEIALTRFLSGLRELLGARVAPARVWLRHDPNHGGRALEEFTACRVETGCADDGFTIDRAILDATPPRANRGLWELVCGVARQELARIGPGPAPDRVEAEVRAALARGEPVTCAKIARRLGTSERTLRRNLAAAGTDFRDIVDGVRRERAAQLLAERWRSIGDIALEVGYADSSAFAHACRRWFGRSPGEQRRGARGV